jgi:hypothetical protein
MQTIAQVQEKALSMLPDVQKSLVQEINYLLESGALNPAQYENDFRLPKIVLYAAIMRIADNYSPLPHDTKGKKESNNLVNF